MRSGVLFAMMLTAASAAEQPLTINQLLAQDVTRNPHTIVNCYELRRCRGLSRGAHGRKTMPSHSLDRVRRKGRISNQSSRRQTNH